MNKSSDFFANAIDAAFDAYCEGFNEITARTRKRFLEEDWEGIRQDATDRLELYANIVDKTVSDLNRQTRDMENAETLWRDVKADFLKIVEKRHEDQSAKTFFNSVTRRVFDIIGVNPGIEFTTADFSVPEIRYEPCKNGSSCYYLTAATGFRHDLTEIIESVLAGYYRPDLYVDIRRDAGRVANVVAGHLEASGGPPENFQMEFMSSVFYRYKGAYLIGRILVNNDIVPLVLCLLNVNGGIFVDAVLMDATAVNILFSFTHAYFHVDISNLDEIVGFIKSIIPAKRVSEIYNSIGYHKLGKSQLFRELMRSLENSEDQFQIARGRKGMVMFVFTFPPFNVVFKVIKDRFDYPKKTSLDYIKNRYSLVFRHDRVGRLIDAQEFVHLELDQNRFSGGLLRELMDKAGNNIFLRGHRIVIRHLYMERRLTPLDIYIEENPPEKVIKVFRDYGWAIKELAASNIFPGDLFFKNFGVTRYGRVVFYDYDELELLTECRFRRIPKPKTYEDAISAEPWFTVLENDVFPEEFKKFLSLPEYVEKDFMEIHGDLFDVDFWQAMQQRLKSHSVIHIFPYKKRYRLDNQSLQSSIYTI